MVAAMVSANTNMRVPLPRGTEPWALSTVTKTAGEWASWRKAERRSIKSFPVQVGEDEDGIKCHNRPHRFTEYARLKLLIGCLTKPCARSVAALAAATSAWLQGCSNPPAPPAPPATQIPSLPAVVPEPQPRQTSLARNAKDYRQDAARHLYALQADKIFKGRLPPMLYAVGVLNVDIDRQGRVQGIHWTRAPKHAPEVMAEIEKMVRAAAPYPAPQHMAKVTYTDVWLWHKSGRFQLDTLTEGQD